MWLIIKNDLLNLGQIENYKFSLELWFDMVKTNGVALIIMSKSNLIMLRLVLI